MKKVFITVVIGLAIAGTGFSQVLLQENFDKAASDAKYVPLKDNAGADLGYTMVQPTGWTITSEIDPDDADVPAGIYPSWTAMDYDAEWNTASENRDMASALSKGIFVADSKLFGNLKFRSWAVTPAVNLSVGTIIIEFDTHYRHERNQIVRLEVSWDSKKTWQPVFQWDDVNRKSKVDYISHEKYGVTAPTGTANFTLRFFYGGDSDQNGYAENDYYCALDNLTVTGSTAVVPAAPKLTASPSDPKGIGGVLLSGSAFTGSAAHASSEWVVASDKDFANVIYTTVSAKDLLSTVVPSGRTKMGTVFYAKVRYIDASSLTSSFSNVVETSLQPPASLVQIEKEDFESTEEYSLPQGWKDVNFNADGGAELNVWSVITADTMATLGSERNTVPVFEGKSCYVTSDGWDPVQDDHLFSKRYNLKGYKNIWLSFWSNYEQNQDNIGVLEYSVDGGDLLADRVVKGTWLPLWYSMKAGEDIFYNADGSIDISTTLGDDKIADGTNQPYSYWVFAKPLSSLAPYMYEGVDDDPVDGKQYPTYRLAAADNQSDVVIRWVNMGTNSWFWGIDNVIIWGSKDTDVAEWSLF